jgi:hypothetical protein
MPSLQEDYDLRQVVFSLVRRAFVPHGTPTISANPCIQDL